MTHKPELLGLQKSYHMCATVEEVLSVCIVAHSRYKEWFSAESRQTVRNVPTHTAKRLLNTSWIGAAIWLKPEPPTFQLF